MFTESGAQARDRFASMYNTGQKERTGETLFAWLGTVTLNGACVRAYFMCVCVCERARARARAYGDGIGSSYITARGNVRLLIKGVSRCLRFKPCEV